MIAAQLDTVPKQSDTTNRLRVIYDVVLSFVTLLTPWCPWR